ncbi:DNA polymerase III subunit beta [Candidatus Shapirobacteria bacterium]|nr:DNA polymerase III subunit beta [Candidatus Shapirobacteria bacterium]
MKIEVLQEELNKALNIVNRFVDSRPQLPILTNILFEVRNKKLKLSATNLNLGINLWLGGKVEKEGEIAVPAREITEFISYLNPGPLSLELNNNQLVVASVANKATFVGIKPEEFPAIPQLPKENVFTLEAKALNEAVVQVGFSAALDETRPVLAGVYWQFAGKEYQMVATDGYRLSLKKVELPKAVLAGKKKTIFLLPARSLSEVARLMAGDLLKVGLTKDENQVVFGFEQVQISSRLLEGEFPEYEKIIPTAVKTKVWVDKNDLHSAIKAASVFAREAANIVILDISKKEIVIKADAPQMGENQSSVPVKVEGEPLKIAFNFKFLLDFINAVSSEENNLILELTEPLSPALFKVEGDDSWLHVIMPVRLEEE